MEDSFSYQHTIGSSDNGSSYVGFIGSITIFNFQVTGFENITYINGGGQCSTCSSFCPSDYEYISCVDACNWDLTSTCVTEGCLDEKLPTCVSQCPVGTFLTENGSCATCMSQVESCNNPNNTRVCDDPLCDDCDPLYAECAFGCVVNAHQEGDVCVCDEEHHVVFNEC